MSETTNTNTENKQFLDKVGLSVLWDKICSIFIGKTDTEHQSDWNETDDSLHSYIKNKPSLAPSNAQKNVQSDWNEADDSSDAFIKNKTHGESLIDVRTIGSYTHTNDITYIRHNGKTFKLELGAKTQINSGPPAWVTLTSSNTILIEESSSGWISTYPVYIIDIQKIDEKYLPDSVLNVNVPQSDWNESFPESPSHINNRTHYIEYATLNGSNQFELSNYTELTPYIVNYNGSTYTLVEGENQLSWGPPMKVILNGTQLTIDESSYIDEAYPLKLAIYVEKLNPVYLNTITLDMIDALWDDMIGIGDAIIETTKLNNSKLVE
jgi:hypothetical protein